MKDARERLVSGSGALGLHLAPESIDRLLQYRDLMVRWNRIHNLTAIRDPEAMLTHHLLDSLAISPYVSGARVLDVGSGAGLPGIPLAVTQPQRQFVLLDASAKRVSFLRQTVVELKLHNVEAVHARIERYRPTAPFATVTSRAFAALRDFVASAQPLLAPGGHLLAMKGRCPDEELQALPVGIRVHAVIGLKVPGLDAQRHLIDLVRA
ncbi:16S rRNA (guanine(527)-N(7))-methyltransferase RsmG [Acidihalobacter ferrooxydans]|uniref:16S rRNA (guanine(527)-N(7))-methyltransferase RsmG n=1 Tax=Acidihalobacter ferrooxydans TaxID=1765967 RepID=UPI001E3498A9|nr:16S rRNA (guanine(527)-N(7))-methyltransferase RsmG [Acidihalobacter ferrooxydans]